MNEAIGLDEMKEVMLNYLPAHIERIKEINIEGAKLTEDEGSPFYEIKVRIGLKGWVATGPARYKPTSDAHVFTIHLSPEDGAVIGFHLGDNTLKTHENLLTTAQVS